MDKKEEKIDLLIKNTVALQNVLTDLASDMNALTADVATLLDLFKEANKAFKEGKAAAGPEAAIAPDIGAKMDRLIEQNKTIAKGIMLLEEFLKEKMETTAKIGRPEERRIAFRPKPLPEFRA